MLTDYHLHLRPDEPDTPPEALLHRRERRSLPRRRRGGRDRGARRLRARLPLPPGARALAPPVLGRERASTTSTPTASSSRGTPLRLGIECDFIPGAEERTAACWRRATSTTSSARSTSSARATPPSTTTAWDVWEGGRRRRRDLAPLLRGARRLRPLGPLRHPRPPGPGQGLGPGAAAARARPPRLLRARGRGDRRERDRGRGLDRRAAQAGRRALPGPRASPRCASRPGRPSRSPPTPTCPSRSASTTSAALEFLDAARGRARSASSRAAGGAWRRSPSRVALRWSGSATTATASRRAAGWSSAESRSSTSSASRATPTPTSSPTP